MPRTLAREIRTRDAKGGRLPRVEYVWDKGWSADGTEGFCSFFMDYHTGWSSKAGGRIFTQELALICSDFV